MIYKIFRNSPQGFMDSPKFRVTFYDNKAPKSPNHPLLRMNYMNGYGGTLKLTLTSRNGIHSWTSIANFDSCKDAKGGAEEILEEELKIKKLAERKAKEDVWTECKC